MVQKIKVELEPEELELLMETADEQKRTSTNQASYYVVQGLKNDNKTKPNKEHNNDN